ncbi:hypothetical protein [Rhodovarius lipocyclicus]|uniref:hypothetical protein n=1 Tax=Rhodovarius lipocyclicus TaxID=268410 RepID=UPI00135B4705|nr:hypothetical protein [Rhodovarius lipocyclicus]
MKKLAVVLPLIVTACAPTLVETPPQPGGGFRALRITRAISVTPNLGARVHFSAGQVFVQDRTRDGVPLWCTGSGQNFECMERRADNRFRLLAHLPALAEGIVAIPPDAVEDIITGPGGR